MLLKHALLSWLLQFACLLSILYSRGVGVLFTSSLDLSVIDLFMLLSSLTFTLPIFSTEVVGKSSFRIGHQTLFSYSLKLSLHDPCKICDHNSLSSWVFSKISPSEILPKKTCKMYIEILVDRLHSSFPFHMLHCMYSHLFCRYVRLVISRLLSNPEEIKEHPR